MSSCKEEPIIYPGEFISSLSTTPQSHHYISLTCCEQRISQNNPISAPQSPQEIHIFLAPLPGIPQLSLSYGNPLKQTTPENTGGQQR